MATIINIHEAKTHLSRIVEEVAAGKEVIIAKAGKPMAKIVPLNDKSATKTLGLLAGKITIPANFNDPLPDSILRSFEAE